MTNLIDTLTASIEEYRATNKNPCKNYGSKEAAEKATAKMAQMAANHFYRYNDGKAKPARYVVFLNEAWGRWVGAIDLTEVLSRESSTGGYLGCCTGFYTY